MTKIDKYADLKGNKRFRRKFSTWIRMLRYGANNFTRNLWLTTAATVVMMITLLIILGSFFARTILNDTVAGLREKVDIPVNLRTGMKESEIDKIRKKFENHSDVIRVEYVSAEQNKKNLIDSGKLSTEYLETIAELPDQPYYATLKLVVRDPSDLSSLAEFVDNDKEIQESLNKVRELRPNFSGDKMHSIKTISGWANTAEKAGLFAGVTFVGISMLIIFNTIRMAIFSRKDEIEMMKLIGADKGFIRGPFVVEAVMYGFVAALLATGLGVAVLLAIEPKLSGYGMMVDSIRNIGPYIPIILIVMIAIGAVLGIVSARLAVRRYLKLT